MEQWNDGILGTFVFHLVEKKYVTEIVLALKALIGSRAKTKSAGRSAPLKIRYRILHAGYWMLDTGG
jgi:hypothetical protein